MFIYVWKALRVMLIKEDTNKVKNICTLFTEL